MAFLLGSFTGGMFSGFSDVQNAFIKGESYKQERIRTEAMQDSLDDEKEQRQLKHNMMGAVGNAMNGDGQPSSATVAPTTSTPSGTNNGPIKTENLAPPAGTGGSKPTDLPLPGGEATGVDTGMTPDVQGSITRHNAMENNYGSEAVGTGDTTPQPVTGTLPGGQPVGGGMATPATSGNYAPTGGATAVAGPPSTAFQQTPQGVRTGGPQAHAPNYGNPNNRVAPPGGTPRPAPGSVSQAIPTVRPGQPSLASGTSGLGAQILAAMNPTAGPTA